MNTTAYYTHRDPCLHGMGSGTRCQPTMPSCRRTSKQVSCHLPAAVISAVKRKPWVLFCRLRSDWRQVRAGAAGSVARDGLSHVVKLPVPAYTKSLAFHALIDMALMPRIEAHQRVMDDR